VNVTKAAKGINLAAEQCQDLTHEMWALGGEIGGLTRAIVVRGVELKGRHRPTSE
jgi:hypothetical protein